MAKSSLEDIRDPDSMWDGDPIPMTPEQRNARYDDGFMDDIIERIRKRSGIELYEPPKRGPKLPRSKDEPED